MNELYFSKGKAPEIDASKWKVALPAVHLALLLTFLFQGVESAINFELPELTVQSDDSSEEDKCAPVTCRFLLVVFSCFEVVAIYLFPFVVPIAENFVLDPGASWEAVQLFPYYLHSPC